jgi:hypothetical protein
MENVNDNISKETIDEIIDCLQSDQSLDPEQWQVVTQIFGKRVNPDEMKPDAIAAQIAEWYQETHPNPKAFLESFFGDTTEPLPDTIYFEAPGVVGSFGYRSETTTTDANGNVTKTVETTSDLADRIKQFREDHRFPKNGLSPKLGLNTKTLKQKPEEILTKVIEEGSADIVQSPSSFDRVKDVGVSLVEVAGGYTIFRMASNIEAETKSERVVKNIVRAIGIGFMVDGILRQIS